MYLYDEELLFVAELLVCQVSLATDAGIYMHERVGMLRTLFVIVEVAQEHKELLLISPQNSLNLWWLLGVCHEDLATAVSSHKAGSFAATLTLKTWNASNCMFLLLSLSKFIIILRFASFAIYRVMTLKFARSSKISPSSWSDWRFVT